MLESPHVGDAGMLGMLVKLARTQRMLAGICWRLPKTTCAVFTVFLKIGQRGLRSQSHGVQMFGLACAQVMQGDAEEELGVQQNTSAVHHTGRVARCDFEVESRKLQNTASLTKR